MTDTIERPVHRLATMTQEHGDLEVTWDPEVEDEVNHARESFDRFMAKGGYAAFRVDEGHREQIRSFEPEAGEIVLARQMQGG